MANHRPRQPARPAAGSAWRSGSPYQAQRADSPRKCYSFSMKIGDEYGQPMRGSMMRAKNGALYFRDSDGALWAKEQGTPSEPPFYGWRTVVSGGLPLHVLAGLVPFTVVAIVTEPATPEELARYEADAQKADRHVTAGLL